MVRSPGSAAICARPPLLCQWRNHARRLRVTVAPAGDAWFAGKWQTARRTEDRNDDPAWTHADVISAFDAAHVAVWDATWRRGPPPTDGGLQ